MRKYLALVALLAFILPTGASSVAATQTLTFQAEVWVDNWFALYINGKKVGEDSTPYNTERSFNSTTIKFTASYPFEIGVVARDYMENSSGLEYIGKSNQQIGDAGLILQIRELSSGQVVAVTNKAWKSLIVQKAPLNPECVSSSNPISDCKSQSLALPTGWASKSFKDATWKSATEFSESEVGVKEGYFNYKWDSKAKLIWSGDLKLDNTILSRFLVTTPTKTTKSVSVAQFTLASSDFLNNGKLPVDLTCDGVGRGPNLSWSGVPTSAKFITLIMDSEPGPARPGEVAGTSHAHLILYNIPSSITTANFSNYPGLLGLNFKDKNPGYTPPCSQGPGDKKYTVTIYATSGALDLTPNQANEASVLAAVEKILISKSSIVGTHSRP